MSLEASDVLASRVFSNRPGGEAGGSIEINRGLPSMLKTCVLEKSPPF